jgi:hypothetical protein
MAETLPPVDGAVPDRLRDVAMRLAAELDEARLYQAAAYASMVADAIDQSRGQPVSARAAATDVEIEFELDEHGRVWEIRDGDCWIIGRHLAVAIQMRRYLAATTGTKS